MTQRTTRPPRICPDCDGFASAAITTGGRDARSHLRIITVPCPACNGLGSVPVRRLREGARA
jgi:hypothetical protein